MMTMIFNILASIVMYPAIFLSSHPGPLHAKSMATNFVGLHDDDMVFKSLCNIVFDHHKSMADLKFQLEKMNQRILMLIIMLSHLDCHIHIHAMTAQDIVLLNGPILLSMRVVSDF